jgi:hypothetical protein
MSKERAILKVFTYFSYISYIRSTKNVKERQKRNWHKIYDHLIQSTHWQGKLKKNLEDNYVTEYKDYQESFNQDKDSGTNSFGKDKVRFWALSGGTSGPPKYFPITNDYKKEFQKTSPPFLYQLIRKYKNFLRKPVLYITSTNPTEQAANNVDIGYISNYNYRHIPSFLKPKYVLPSGVLQSSKLFEKYAHLYTLASDLSAIISITPLSLHNFYNKINQQIEECLSLIESLDPKKDGLPAFNISKDRMRYLKNLTNKQLTIKDLWPSLGFICCWKTSTCSLQLENLIPKIGNVDIVDATYSATEGWINVPFADPNKNGGPIHPDAVIVEFSVVNDPTTLIKAWDLSVNEYYEVYITNYMGLVRYRLFDVIKCTGFINKSPIVEFSHKAGQQLSLGMCVISEAEILNVMANLSSNIQNFFFTAHVKGNGLTLYTQKEIVSSEILNEIDSALKLLNLNYKKYRESEQINKPTCIQDDSEFWYKEKHAQSKQQFIYQKRPW